MKLTNKNIGYAISGSICYFEKSIFEMKKISNTPTYIFPIMSSNNYKLCQKNQLTNTIEQITNKKIIHSNAKAEHFCLNHKLDILLIAPCSGTTISKLANDISDTPITIIANSILKYNKPIVIGICANNGLSSSAENIGKLLNRKNYYFVPFMQNNPLTKPRSLSCDYSQIKRTLEFALENKQINTIII